MKILQSFEPEGIGARSLNECLWIQIQNYDLDHEDDRDILKELVKVHLDDIASNSYEFICDSMDISLNQLKTYIDFITHLNPNPALAYSGTTSQSVQPSLRVEISDGEIRLINLEKERIALTLNPEMIAKHRVA